MRIVEKIKELNLYFKGFLLITILYTIFAIYTLTQPLGFRWDFVGYLTMGMIIYGFGFKFGYRKFGGEKKEKIDAGMFYGLLFFVASMQMAVCIFDNIVIVLWTYAPVPINAINLNGPMEIQFIFVYFITVSQYRFFTIIYLITGFITILYVRKRSTLLLASLFMTYIYSSLVFGYILKMPISLPYLNFSHLLIYLFINLLIGILFFIIFLIIRLKYDKSFDFSPTDTEK